MNFAPSKIPLVDNSPRKCIHGIPAQETAKPGAPARFQARVGKDFWRKFGAKRRNFFEFAHPGVQFVHPGFNSMGGQRPSCDYLNKS